MIIFGMFMFACILWWIGTAFAKQGKQRQPKWDTDFCVLPGVDERCFIYEYGLPTQEKHDAQFWAMVDFVNEQATLKQRRLA
jgi:hypothetical protein